MDVMIFLYSSYKVIAVDDVKQDKANTSQGNVSNQDDSKGFEC